MKASPIGSVEFCSNMNSRNSSSVKLRSVSPSRLQLSDGAFAQEEESVSVLLSNEEYKSMLSLATAGVVVIAGLRMGCKG